MNQKHMGCWCSDLTRYQSIKNEYRISHENLGLTDRTSEPTVHSLLSVDGLQFYWSLPPSHFTLSHSASSPSLCLTHLSLPAGQHPRWLKLAAQVPAEKEQSVPRGCPLTCNKAVPQADARYLTQGVWKPFPACSPETQIERKESPVDLSFGYLEKGAAQASEPRAAAGAIGGLILLGRDSGAHRLKKPTSTSL